MKQKKFLNNLKESFFLMKNVKILESSSQFYG